MNKDHIEKSLSQIREIFEKASDRIDAIKVGDKIPATVLAAEIAKEFGSTGPILYPTLLWLIKGYPGVEVRRGAKGGIYKLALTNISSIEENDFSFKEEDKILPIINT